MQKRLPPLPTKLATPHGTIPVERYSSDEDCGEFDRTTRRIRIDGSMAHSLKWQTFWHEVGEVAVFDSGVYHILNEKQKDAMLDAIAGQLTTMMLSGQLKVSRSWERDEAP